MSFYSENKEFIHTDPTWEFQVLALPISFILNFCLCVTLLINTENNSSVAQYKISDIDCFTLDPKRKHPIQFLINLTNPRIIIRKQMNINVIPYLVLFSNHAGFQGQVQFRLEWRFQLVVFKSWVWWFCNTQNLHEADNCFGRHVAAASSGSKWTMTTAIIPVHCLSFSHGFLATRLISGGYGGSNARKLLGLLE